VNNPTVKITFPTGNSKQDQQGRITASIITLQNLNGPGKGCPGVSTTLKVRLLPLYPCPLPLKYSSRLSRTRFKPVRMSLLHQLLHRLHRQHRHHHRHHHRRRRLHRPTANPPRPKSRRSPPNLVRTQTPIPIVRPFYSSWYMHLFSLCSSLW
jgi:hypothetical protein